MPSHRIPVPGASPRRALAWAGACALGRGVARLLLALALAALPALWPDPTGAGPGRALAATQPAVLYHNYCSVCHGDKGDGKSRASGSFSTAPRDFTAEAARRELTRERLVSAITHGRPGTAMVGWKTQLSEADIGALADYLLAQFIRHDARADGRGRRIYEKTCSVCHGEHGAGALWAGGNMTRAPRDFTSAQAAGLTREAMVAAVTHGLPGTPMAGFAGQLPPQDIDAVVDYIRSSLMPQPISGTRAHGGREADAASTPARADMTAGLPNGLKGNLRRGGAFYQANCAACHGQRGDGAGPRAYFINPRPRNFVEPVSRALLNRTALYAAISEGRLRTEMPAWNKVATEQQIADVAEYVFQTFIRGAAAPPTPATAAAPR